MSLKIIDWQDFIYKPAASGDLPPRHPGPKPGGIATAFPCAMTIGVFDGVHLGHCKLINRIVARGPNPTVITFRENPKKIISPINFEGDLFSLRQKIAVFESLGVEQIVLIDFSADFCKLKGKEFLDLLGSDGKMTFLAVGANFRCGHGLDTDAGLIAKLNAEKGIVTEVVKPVVAVAADGKPTDGNVSSSRIRAAVIGGNLALAAILLGRNFELDIEGLEPSEIKPGKVEYDLRSRQRVVPADGKYSVVKKFSGGIAEGAEIFTEGGKIIFPQIQAGIESLEFL